MHRATRTPVDTDGDNISKETGLDFSESPSLARQEFKDETDVNVILKRFGLNTPVRPLAWGSADYTLNLQTALEAIAQAKAMHRALPDTLRAKYASWREVLFAIEQGGLTREQLLAETAPEPTPAPAPVPTPEVKA